MPRLEAAIVSVKHRIAEELEVLEERNDPSDLASGDWSLEKASVRDQRPPMMAPYWPSPNCVTFEFFDVVAPLVPGDRLLSSYL